MRAVEFVQQAELLVGVGLLGQRLQVRVDALVQDAAEVAQVHELLGEQVVAVALDEALQPLPAVAVADAFPAPRAARRGCASSQQRNRTSTICFQAVDQVALGGRWRSSAACPLSSSADESDQAADDRLAADLEHAVELGDRAGADRMVELHVLDGFQQPAGLAQQAQPGQIGQQAAQHVLQARARRRSAAGCRRGPATRTTAAASAARRAARATPRGPPSRRRATRPRNTRLTGRLPAVGLGAAGRGCSIAARIIRAASAVSTHAAMICSSSVSLIAPAAVVFDQRFVRAARRRNAIAMHGRQQLQQLLAVADRPGRASRPARRRGRPAAPSADARPSAASFHNWATVVEKRQPVDDPLGLGRPARSRSAFSPVSNISPSMPSSVLSR